jgi:hypothetical protein
VGEDEVGKLSRRREGCPGDSPGAGGDRQALPEVSEEADAGGAGRRELVADEQPDVEAAEERRAEQEAWVQEGPIRLNETRIQAVVDVLKKAKPVEL